MRYTIPKLPVYWTCALLIAAALPAMARAVEPADDFIKALEARGYHETALDYLERMKDNPRVSEDFRNKTAYHRGSVLLEQSRQASDPATRNRLLADARSELEAFAKDNSDSVAGADAQMQLASGQMSRGQELNSQAAQLPAEPEYDSQRDQLRRDARELFANARKTLEDAGKVYSTELDKLPPATEEKTSNGGATQRQEYRGRVAQLRYLAAQAQFELARTHNVDSKEYVKLNTTTAKDMGAIYEEFARTNSLVALYARLAEGRCYQALGNTQLAMGCFDEILSQPSAIPQFRNLFAATIQRKAELLIVQEKLDEAIEACRSTLQEAGKDEEKEPEWLAVRYRLAEALDKKGEKLTAESLERRKLDSEARDAYRLVANSPSEYQSAARLAVATIRVNKADAETKEPQSFQEAYDLGKEALASYNSAKLSIPAAERNNPAAVTQLQKQMEDNEDEARRYFSAAATLVEPETDLRQLNEVRYFLCWLYWESQDFYRAAILGEFLARRFPDHPAASSAAKISMAAFEQLLSRAASGGSRKGDTEFESRRMAQMAEFISKRWPGSPDADVAFGVLVSYAIRTNRIGDAEKLLAETSEKSRPRLELQLGNAIWARYLDLSRPSAANKIDAAELAGLKQSAEKYLRSGFDAAVEEDEVSDAAATAALYLVQAQLSDGNYDEATKLLENKKAGPLTLVSGSHAVASRPAFVAETSKPALRAYVSTTPPQEKKALETMKSLEKSLKAAGDENAASEQLTRIYIGIGIGLQKQAEELRKQGQEREAERVTAAFAKFLDRIEIGPASNWPTRMWLAQTYYNMGSGGLDPRDAGTEKPLSKSATEYLTKARDAYQKLLEEVAKDPKAAPSADSLTAARMQLGESYRALAQYQQAIDAFSEILKEKETSLAVQKAAAYAYQGRGQKETVEWLERAIQGGERMPATGQNRVWGWLKISNVAARGARQNEQFKDVFFEARFNIAKCRYLIAMKKSGAEQKQDLIKAQQNVQSLVQLYPDLGGDAWRERFDELLKDIQKALGEKTVGLGESPPKVNAKSQTD